jgi:tyrosyl-tRNA synthetase
METDDLATLSSEQREKVTTMFSGVDEVIGVEHLVNCLTNSTSHAGDGIIRAYVGFEPSGKAHIGWKVVAQTLQRLLDADVNVLIFLADWHAWVNDKFGGDMDKIRLTATYMEEVFRSLLNNPEEGDGAGQLRFLYASDLMDSGDYWARVLKCSKNMSLDRVRRTFSIMGRSEDSSDGDLSKFFYPAMQAADIFEMNIDIALGGMDQRKAHMYMRRVADRHNWVKATCVHTPILSGLKSSGARMESFDHKMSKTDPGGALLLHDDATIMRKKMRKAYLDPQDENSPVYELIEHIIFPESGTLTITPKPEYGNPSTWDGLEELKTAVAEGEIHPLDLKFGVADALAETLKSLTAHFEEHSQLLEQVNAITTS